MFATPALAQSPKVIDLRTPVAAKQHAKTQLKVFGWAGSQWSCLETLWTKESNWRPDAKNRQAISVVKNGKKVKVHAGGIPQILGLNPKTSVMKQVQLGMIYIESRYSSPCKALQFHKRNNWY